MEESKKYVDEDGNITWYLPSKGKDHWHRLDGPSIEFMGGTKEWYVDGKLHRLDGPAVEWSDGTKQWCINNNYISTKEIRNWLEENNIDLKTEVGQMAFKLRFS